MAEANRYPKLIVEICGKDSGDPSPKTYAPPSQVDGHVEYLALEGAHQLSLRRRVGLEVNSSDRTGGQA